MKIVWREVTRNSWWAELPGGVTLGVDRHRSWKARHDPKPFKITVFGNVWAQPHRDGYETIDAAQHGAEQIAKQVVRGLVKWAAR